MLFGRRHWAMPAVLCCGLVTLLAPARAWGQSLDAKAQGLAHYIMAVGYDLNDQSAQAADEYKKSIQANGLQPAPRLRLGAYYLRSDRVNLAKAQLKKVIRLSPQESQAHYLLALIYSSEHQYDLAASEYEIVLKCAAQDQPADTDIYLYLGQLYYAQQKLPQAIEQFLKIIQLDPRNTTALYLLGSVYADNHERAKAIGLFRDILKFEPDNDGALNSLGYMYAEDGGHLDEALRLVRRAIVKDPANGAYYDSLGWVYYKKGMFAEAVAALQKAVSYIQDPLLYEHLGDGYRAMKKDDLAVKYWRKSLELDGHQRGVQMKIREIKK